jgi:hypothetical protein
MIGTNDINGNVDVTAAPTRLGKLIDDITTRAQYSAGCGNHHSNCQRWHQPQTASHQRVAAYGCTMISKAYEEVVL